MFNDSEYVKKRYRKLKGVGLCTSCGKEESRPGLLTCGKCAKELSERNKKYIEKLKVINIDKYNKIYGKERYKTRTTYQSTISKSLRKSQKETVIEAYGGKCSCCGEENPIFLTVDHINEDGSKHLNGRGIRYMGTEMYRYLIKNDFPEGFQILCWNCNAGKHFNGGVCPHQKGGGDING